MYNLNHTVIKLTSLTYKSGLTHVSLFCFVGKCMYTQLSHCNTFDIRIYDR